MRILSAALLPFLLMACGKSGPDNNREASGGLQAGKWTLSTTLGTPLGMGAGREPPLVIPLCLGAERAEMPVGDVILSMASRGQCGTDGARFERGTISGALRCRGMDDIPEHQEQISGSYGRNSFRITIDMPVHGAVVRQTIEARRTSDC
jgi:uncharacterized protein DUF3617